PRLQGWSILEAAPVSYGQATSYFPVIDLLKGYFKIQSRDEPRAIREKVTGKVLTLDEALKPTLPALLSLLSVPADDDTEWRALDPGPAPLKQRLVEHGNPFFLEETVRTLVETNLLVGQPGRYRLTQPIHALNVPPTVQAVLAARIDRLAPEDKRLLQTASVVGNDVPLSVIQEIAELPDEALRRGLDRLRAAEFVYEAKLFPEIEYTFTHA